MHEFSLMKDLINQISQVAAEHQAKRVVSLRVRLGALAHISPEHFREHFLEATKGGIAENSTLFIEVDDNHQSPTAQDIILDSIELDS